jgi:hypothetical protein
LLQSFEDFLLSWSICGFQSTSTPTAWPITQFSSTLWPISTPNILLANQTFSQTTYTKTITRQSQLHDTISIMISHRPRWNSSKVFSFPLRFSLILAALKTRSSYFLYFLQYKTRKNWNSVPIVSIQQKQRDRGFTLLFARRIFSNFFEVLVKVAKFWKSGDWREKSERSVFRKFQPKISSFSREKN